MTNVNRWKILDGEIIIGVYDRLWTARDHARRYADEHKVTVTLVDNVTAKTKLIGLKYSL